jgi:hypothetical protein
MPEVQFIKRRPVPDNLIHLHWLHHQGPRSLQGVVTAIALCGQRRVPASGKITSQLTEATCPRCRSLSGST